MKDRIWVLKGSACGWEAKGICALEKGAQSRWRLTEEAGSEQRSRECDVVGLDSILVSPINSFFQDPKRWWGERIQSPGSYLWPGVRWLLRKCWSQKEADSANLSLELPSCTRNSLSLQWVVVMLGVTISMLEESFLQVISLVQAQLLHIYNGYNKLSPKSESMIPSILCLFPTIFFSF